MSSEEDTEVISVSNTPEAKSATSRLVILFPLPFASIVLFVNVSVLEPVTTVPSILIVKVVPEPTVSIPVPPAIVKVSVSKSIFYAPPESPWKSKSCALREVVTAST